MIAPRLPLEALASHILDWKTEYLQRIVSARLAGSPVEELPRRGRDEDPADIFIDIAGWLREQKRPWPQLAEACARLAQEWAEINATQVRVRPEPLGELHFLCARIGAVEAREGIARVVTRPDLRGILLQSGEGLQLRALRCLAGLLALVPPDERQRFLGLFIEALAVPNQLPAALTALLAFDPDQRLSHFERARSAWLDHFESVREKLDRNVELLRAEMGEAKGGA